MLIMKLTLFNGIIMVRTIKFGLLNNCDLFAAYFINRR
jgi:hypothetical protein